MKSSQLPTEGDAEVAATRNPEMFPKPNPPPSPQIRRFQLSPNFSRVAPCVPLGLRHGDGHDAPQIFPESAGEAERGSVRGLSWGRSGSFGLP